jgi:ABC-type Zn uptake system ZnuABC Zn-binding protein ZnuA
MPDLGRKEKESMKYHFIFPILLSFVLFISACQSSRSSEVGNGNPLAIESFLADIAQNVAGDRMTVDTLIPPGLDPHSFEATPQDVVKISNCPILIINGAGLEEWLAPILSNVQKDKLIITASSGLSNRTSNGGSEELDPHFWLDPINVIRYVENIRDGFIQADPGGTETYQQNAQEYIAKLQELDKWIKEQVAAIHSSDRKLITNHESLGYFANRYGFEVIGAIIPSTTTGSSPSAEELARLVDLIYATGAKAIFVEAGSNLQLASQLSNETGIKVVPDLYSHSMLSSDGSSSSYIEMMKHNVTLIVETLR